MKYTNTLIVNILTNFGRPEDVNSAAEIIFTSLLSSKNSPVSRSVVREMWNIFNKSSNNNKIQLLYSIIALYTDITEDPADTINDIYNTISAVSSSTYENVISVILEDRMLSDKQKKLIVLKLDRNRELEMQNIYRNNLYLKCVEYVLNNIKMEIGG